MRRLFLIAALAGGLLSAAPVAAQTPAAPANRPPSPAPGTANGSGLFLGGIVGGGSVQNAGGLFGGELGVRVSDMVDIFGEGVWMQDVVTRRRLETANTVGAYLQSS